MSEEVQRRAAKRRDDARIREVNARRRAERNAKRGEQMLARLHKQSADLQADAAAAAEQLRRGDAAIEGDQLDD